jgi:hypothetical protein
MTHDINIKIIGYYDHSNLGDEQYKTAFNNILYHYFNDTVDIEYIDCDRLSHYTFSTEDVIVLGGGDILNDYFMDKIIATFNNKLNKVIAISTGLPFTPILTNTDKLYIIDYLFIRTKQDIELFSNYFNPTRIFYIPDISYVNIDNAKKTKNKIINDLLKVKKTGRKIVTVSLSQHIESSPNYNDIVNSLVNLMKYLVTFNFHVILLPYNTNSQNNNENDIILHTEIYNRISNYNITNNITNIKTTLDIKDVLNIYDYVDYNISMRFHGFLLGIYKGVPSLPIYSTRKIENLIADINYPIFYKLPVNDSFQPTECKIENMITSFSKLIDTRTEILNVISDYNGTIFTDLYKSLDIFYKLIHNSYNKLVIQGLLNETDSCIHKLYKIIQQYVMDTYGLDDFRMTQSENGRNVIVGITSYYLVGSINSKYNYGLQEKMFKRDTLFDWYSEWKWILQNEKYTDKSTKLFSNPDGVFNINYIDQSDNSGVHRSGWQYVYKSILQYHNDNAPLLLDMYVDRTFHWNFDINKLLGIIPYKKNWVGFIHHTFDTSFSEYNCNTLIEIPEFIESLKCCKGIFVLSEYLKKQLQNIDQFRGIPIINLVHPTCTEVPLFTIDDFVKNQDKKVIYIGGWLRNTFTFYNIQLPKNLKIRYGYGIGDSSSKFIDTVTFSLRRVALVGKNMNNYYPTSDFMTRLYSILVKKYNNGQDHNPPNISHHHFNIPNITEVYDFEQGESITNNWNKFFYNHILNTLKDVDYISYLDNDEYDKLLSENIVFIHLVDASAVNTVIECVVRNTPLIINKHPAVVELLGEKYPLFFTSIEYNSINSEINSLLSNTNNIKNATKHLSKLDKSIYNIDYFISKFVSSVKELK